MNRIGAFHSPATFAFRGKELTVQLFLPDGESEVEALWLSYTVTLLGGKGGAAARVRMLPADGFTAQDSFSLYRARIPARDLVGGELYYSFFRGDAESETYTVPLFDLPAMPPLTITEIAPFSGEACSYIELHNPTAHTVDLYDFDLLLEVNGAPAGRNPLAIARGKQLLDGGALAAIRFLSGDAHTDFCEDMAREFPNECGDIAELAPLTFSIPMDGKEGFLLPRYSFETYTYHIVPRGASAESAVFSVTLNERNVDIRRTRSVLIAADPRTPQQGRVTARMAPPTPGFRGEGEGILDLADTKPPAILPIEPEGRCRITAGDLKFRFAVVCRTVADAAVLVRVGNTYRRLPATLQNDGIFEAVLPHRDALSLGARLSYYIEVTGGLYTASCGDRHAPMTLRIADGAGPLITHTHPAEGEVLEKERRPQILVRFADLSGVNHRTSIFCLDGKNLSDRAVWQTDAVTYTPERPLSFGKHVIELSLRDMTGNRTYRRIEFGVSDGKTLYPFRGDLHAHTTMSDGTGAFADAYPYARDVGKVDFFAVTDHSHYLTDEEFAACHERAHAESTKDFVALFGEEVTWSHREGYWGHMNLIEQDERISARALDLPTLYERLGKDPRAIAMFNHPSALWGDFDAFGHITPEARERVCLLEAPNALYDSAYALALSRGWRVAPFANEDHHGKQWTAETRGTGVLLSPALTRANLLDAIRQRRAYSTTDHTLRLLFAINRTPLGGILHAPDQLTVTVKASTARQEGLGRLQLIAEDNLVIAEVNAGVLRDFSWEIEVDPDFDYYYLRIVNGQEYAVTAPVFVTGRDDLAITELSLGTTDDPTKPYAVALTVENTGDHALSELAVDLYLSSAEGFRLRDAVPFATVRLDRLEEGEMHRIVQAFPDVKGNRRVTAVVSGMLGKRRFADTRYLLLSPVHIAKILPCSSCEGDVQHPYPYIELHNPTAAEVSLDGCLLQRRRIVGREPTAREQMPLDGIVIPARGRVVIWRRPAESALTVADFNARYGTSLTEGVDIMVTEQAILSPTRLGCRVELWQGDELLSCAAYGNYCGKEELIEDRACLFAPAEDMTPNARKLPPVDGIAPLDGVESAVLPLYGGDVLTAAEDEHPKAEQKTVTKLSRKPLVPLQAAALLAGAVSALKDVFGAKE